MAAGELRLLRGKGSRVGVPLEPVFAEEFDGMLGAHGSVSAAEVVGRTVLIAPPADAFRVLGMQSDLRLFSGGVNHDFKDRVRGWGGAMTYVTAAAVSIHWESVGRGFAIRYSPLTIRKGEGEGRREKGEGTSSSGFGRWLHGLRGRRSCGVQFHVYPRAACLWRQRLQLLLYRS